MTINLHEKPPWAAYIWTDDRSIWLELPCPVGKTPVLVQYPRSEAGMAKATSLVEQCANIKRAAPLPGWYRQMPSKPKVRKSKPAKKPTVLTNAPSELLDVLKKIMP